jgi:hypothetical protein
MFGVESIITWIWWCTYLRSSKAERPARLLVGSFTNDLIIVRTILVHTSQRDSRNPATKRSEHRVRVLAVDRKDRHIIGSLAKRLHRRTESERHSSRSRCHSFDTRRAEASLILRGHCRHRPILQGQANKAVVVE